MDMNTNTTSKQPHTTASVQNETAQKKFRRNLIGGAVFCVSAIILAMVGSYWSANPFLSEKEGYVYVRSDMTAADVADELYRDGYITSETYFRVAATLSGQAGQLKEGEYIVSTAMSVHDILEKLTSGNFEAVRLVIPEGYTVRQIAQRVAAECTVSEEKFLEAAKDTSLLYPYMNGNRTVTFPTEGFLFPDTYFVPVNASAADIVAMMLKNFDDHLTDTMKKEIAANNQSIYQFVTLASLVEKEAKYDEDRPLISSVFLNRLDRHMKLQSDASISYAMGTHKAAYSIAETKYDSPYNTYLYEGLPPGPIANPGMACMDAILQAPKTSYFYFVADKDGHNYFAMTYEDHMKNVEEHMP